MKKFFLLAAFVVLSITATFADDLNNNIIENLKSSYPSAVNIQWEIKDEFTVVEFTFNGQRLRNFYDNDGILLGISQPEKVTDVPAAYKAAIAKKYPAGVITEAMFFTNKDKSVYQYVSVALPGRKVTLQFSEKGHMSVFNVER